METLQENTLQGIQTGILEVTGNSSSIAEDVKQDILNQLKEVPESNLITVSYMLIAINASS